MTTFLILIHFHVSENKFLVQQVFIAKGSSEKPQPTIMCYSLTSSFPSKETHSDFGSFLVLSEGINGAKRVKGFRESLVIAKETPLGTFEPQQRQRGFRLAPIKERSQRYRKRRISSRCVTVQREETMRSFIRSLLIAEEAQWSNSSEAQMK